MIILKIHESWCNRLFCRLTNSIMIIENSANNFHWVLAFNRLAGTEIFYVFFPIAIKKKISAGVPWALLTPGAAAEFNCIPHFRIPSCFWSNDKLMGVIWETQIKWMKFWMKFIENLFLRHGWNFWIVRKFFKQKPIFGKIFAGHNFWNHFHFANHRFDHFWQCFCSFSFCLRQKIAKKSLLVHGLVGGRGFIYRNFGDAFHFDLQSFPILALRCDFVSNLVGDRRLALHDLNVDHLRHRNRSIR